MLREGIKELTRPVKHLGEVEVARLLVHVLGQDVPRNGQTAFFAFLPERLDSLSELGIGEEQVVPVLRHFYLRPNFRDLAIELVVAVCNLCLLVQLIFERREVTLEEFLGEAVHLFEAGLGLLKDGAGFANGVLRPVVFLKL